MTATTKARIIIVLNLLTVIGAAITVILLFNIVFTAAENQTAINKQIVESQKVTEKELRCLATFFSQPSRQNLRISDLEKCEILHTDTGQTEVLTLAPANTVFQSSPAVPSDNTKQNSITNPLPTQSKNEQKDNSQNPGSAKNCQSAPRETTPASLSQSLLGGALQQTPNIIPLITVCAQ